METGVLGTKVMRGRGRGRGRARGRARGRGRGRGKKIVKTIDSDEEEMPLQLQLQPDEENMGMAEGQDENCHPPKIDLEADISQLEAPTFTTINRGPPEPMLRLRWDHRVNLIGEKVLNPMIHCCDKCLKPILIYGRMIPCKHVFCLSCGKREDKVCPRCLEKVTRVEQTGLGTVFMCTHGGTRYGNAGCRRTYLSQRDLQAHINHRHIAVPASMEPQFPLVVTGGQTKVPQPPDVGNPLPPPRLKPPMGVVEPQRLKPPSTVGDPRIQHIPPTHRRSPPPQPISTQPAAFNPHRPPIIHPVQAYPTPPPITQHQPQNQRTNLITVPIQDNTSNQMMIDQSYHHYQQQGYVGYSVPPPQPAYYGAPQGGYPPQAGNVQAYPQPPPNQPPPRPQYQDPNAQQYGQPPPNQWHQQPNNQQTFYR